ncbi:hypothetical protein IAQ61_000682 [Plenodomus lingam]|uniref:Uncharacterized protein n=1 Tax=Leptosphaeria maculans (strain JN3 / isolate v23.1.3 / race Av1-4-5-6-7-8) TaxID=985895 RepID=E5A6F4_LEPMJ|nr:predicted protein [Plenodomus lingam JN3]KAH9880391.1 hypothetical protein IAQ61_000682 [Plenodomus lingam]CBX99199.1 predicted protein [Plenodomus lingam JN3]
MACALGSSGRGPFAPTGSYDHSYSCPNETYYPYQERPYSGQTNQQRHPYAHPNRNRQSLFGGLGGSAFSNYGPSNPYTRPRSYPDFGANLGMGTGMNAGIGAGMNSTMGYGSRSFGFSQSPFAGLQSPRGIFAGSMPGREQRDQRDQRSQFSPSNNHRGQAGTRIYQLPQFLDDDDESVDEDYRSFIQHASQRQRQAPFGCNQRPIYGICFDPRRHCGYDNYDDYKDDEVDDYFSHPTRQRQRFY